MTVFGHVETVHWSNDTETAGRSRTDLLGRALAEYRVHWHRIKNTARSAHQIRPEYINRSMNNVRGGVIINGVQELPMVYLPPK